MKKLLATISGVVIGFCFFLLLTLGPEAIAQCNGVFPANTICGKLTSSGIPGPVANSALTGVPGGSSGQIQYNNNGNFGGTTLVPATSLATVRVAKTANYTAANSECGSTYALGGSAFFTLTFTSASNYSTTCAYRVINEDTGRAKFLSINSFIGPASLTGFFLWPGQTAWVINDNNTWRSDGPFNWIIPSGQTVYISSGGTDWTAGANDCLLSGSGCALPQKAYDLISNFFDLSSNAATIQFNNGTYTLANGVTAISMLGQLHGSGRQGTQGSWLQIAGNTSASLVTINTSAANAFACDQGCSALISGMTINLVGGSGNQGNAFIADNLGMILFGNVIVNGTSANHIATANSSAILQCTGNTSASGIFINALYSLNGNSGLACDSRTITLTGATTASAFLDARGNSYLEWLATTVNNPGSFTGAQFNIVGNSYVDSTGSTIPGTSGTVQFGGVIRTNATSSFQAADGGIAWISYIPTLGCGTGTITSSSATGRSKSIGKTIFLEADITITNSGSCASFLSFTLPFTGAAAKYVLPGKEINVAAKTVTAFLTTSAVSAWVTNYDGTFPATSGTEIVITGTYEVP